MVALIEIGDCPKSGYVGALPTEKTKATIYYYDDISAEELRQEIRDLKEFYDGVGIMTPYPDGF